MLSIEKCRELMNVEGLSDEQVLALGDSLYQLAELAVDLYLDPAVRRRFAKEQPAKLSPAAATATPPDVAVPDEPPSHRGRRRRNRTSSA